MPTDPRPPFAERPRMIAPAMLIGVLALVVGLLAWGIDHLRRWRPDPVVFAQQGVILGADNAPIAWGRLIADGVRFTYLDATDGATGSDPTFLAARDAARGKGLRYGAVHRYNPCASATDQAANFSRLVPRDTGQLSPLVIFAPRSDCTVEPSAALLRSEWQTLSGLLQRQSGRRPILLLMPPYDSRYPARDLGNIRHGVASTMAPPKMSDWTIWLASPYARTSGAHGQVRWIVINPKR